MSDLFEAIILVLTAAVVVVVLGLLFVIPSYFLWNYCLVPAINGVNEITWLQAWGINILCGILFRTKFSK